MTIDTNELRMLAQAALTGPDGISLSWIKLLQDFQQNAGPATILELINRLEAAESEALEQARLNGMGAERELALIAKLEAAEWDRATFIMEIGNLCTKVEALREELSKQQSLSQAAQQLAEVAQRRADALRAKIEQMERQEPVKHEFQGRDGVWYPFIDQRHHENTVADGSWPVRALYALPGAQSAQSVSDGLTPLESIQYWADAYANPKGDAHFIGHAVVERLLREYADLRAMLAAAPEAKS